MVRTCLLTLCLLLCSAVFSHAAAPHLVVAHDGTWPPMEFVDDKLNVVGYSVDYIDAVAKEAGFTVKHENVAWDGIFAGLAGKQYDVVASSVTITEERAKVMDFSTPYYTVRQAILTMKDSTAATLDDFKGKNVGAQIGTTGFFAAEKVEGIKALTYDEVGLAVADLAVGRLDAVICDDPVATNFILDNKEFKDKMKVAFVVPAETPEYYGFAVDKGNTEVLELLNKGIKAVKEKGIEDELIKKWMGQ